MDFDHSDQRKQGSFLYFLIEAGTLQCVLKLIRCFVGILFTYGLIVHTTVLVRMHSCDIISVKYVYCPVL
jgi:hypothetical protein